MQTAIDINTGNIFLLENFLAPAEGGEGGGITSQKTVITTSGDNGVLTSEQLAAVLDDNLDVIISNAGEYYTLVESNSTYKTYVNINTPTTTQMTCKSIYVNVSSIAVNYGAWTKEVNTVGGTVLIEAGSTEPVATYTVPSLTGEQVTEAFNGIVTGKQVIITSNNGAEHYTVNQAYTDNTDTSYIVILYRDALILKYDFNGNISHKEL